MKLLTLTNSSKKAIVDKEDYPLLSRSKWFLTPKGYVYLATQAKLPLHRFICPPKYNYIVDHINHNPLDNRKSNLRLVTRQQSRMNSRSKNSTGYMGVIRNKTATKKQSYYAVITKEGKIRRAVFPTALAAAKARDIWAKEWFGQYAVLNFPDIIS